MPPLDDVRATRMRVHRAVRKVRDHGRFQSRPVCLSKQLQRVALRRTASVQVTVRRQRRHEAARYRTVAYWRSKRRRRLLSMFRCTKITRYVIRRRDDSPRSRLVYMKITVVCQQQMSHILQCARLAISMQLHSKFDPRMTRLGNFSLYRRQRCSLTNCTKWFEFKSKKI